VSVPLNDAARRLLDGRTSPRLPPWAPADSPIPRWYGSTATATPWCSRSRLTSRRHGTWRATLGCRCRCRCSTSTTHTTAWKSGERRSWQKIPGDRCRSVCRSSISASRRRLSRFFPRAASAYAEYVAAPSRQLARKPTGLSYAEAAALPLAGLTAWQALVDTAQVAADQRVLIHGAGGGVHSAVGSGIAHSPQPVSASTFTTSAIPVTSSSPRQAPTRVN